MPDHTRDQTSSTTETNDASTTRNGRETAAERTAEQWRELLRKEQLPEPLAELPFRKRRRARKAWRSARRDARAAWVKRERRAVPTPVSVPIIALVLAGLVGAASWLWPDQDSTPARTTPHHTPTAQHPPAPDATVPPAPTPSHTPQRPQSPDDIAKAFVTAYCTRNPARDASHVAAVNRAAQYASTALVDNLTRHNDLDWNQLIAAQASTATPSSVTLTTPADTQQLPPDTSIRVYRQATARIDVKGTDNYSYIRHLTIEVSRGDVGQPWQVTRVLGVQE
ncbi:hypothetical protein [Streptomyces noursei]|uniref:hypothetical protein n=1 Tax=Streptomyces noursei TaxID=1971 RepID=UPI0016731CD1|nr:hypothetical protein [Streptomyces noursei]MCZ1021395.1 hypothetical protein [Streptomyces noursei]GGX46171.1 hypothetical protein GCM10010341_79830 [Streptomyces noursei]